MAYSRQHPSRTALLRHLSRQWGAPELGPALAERGFRDVEELVDRARWLTPQLVRTDPEPVRLHPADPDEENPMTSLADIGTGYGLTVIGAVAINMFTDSGQVIALLRRVRAALAEGSVLALPINTTAGMSRYQHRNGVLADEYTTAPAISR